MRLASLSSHTTCINHMSIGLFKENETGALLNIHLYDYIAKIVIDNKYKYIYITIMITLNEGIHPKITALHFNISNLRWLNFL